MKIALMLAFVAWSAAAFAQVPPVASTDPSAAPAPQSAAASVVDTVKGWFKMWKDGLADSAVEGQFQNRSLTAVAAVRGDEQEVNDPDKPYIKGRLSDLQARELKTERAELSQAVDLILSGKTGEGSKALDDFETKHPKSTLLGDVHKAREKLKELKTASAN